MKLATCAPSRRQRLETALRRRTAETQHPSRQRRQRRASTRDAEATLPEDIFVALSLVADSQAPSEAELAEADLACRVLALATRCVAESAASMRGERDVLRWRGKSPAERRRATRDASIAFLSQVGILCEAYDLSPHGRDGMSVAEMRSAFLGLAASTPSTVCSACASTALMTHVASWMAVEQRCAAVQWDSGRDACLLAWSEHAARLCAAAKPLSLAGSLDDSAEERAPLPCPDDASASTRLLHQLYAKAFRQLRGPFRRSVLRRANARCLCHERPEARTGEPPLLLVCLARAGELLGAVRIVRRIGAACGACFQHVDSRDVALQKLLVMQTRGVLASTSSSDEGAGQVCPALLSRAFAAIASVCGPDNRQLAVALGNEIIPLPHSELLYACAALRRGLLSTGVSPMPQPLLAVFQACNRVLTEAVARVAKSTTPSHASRKPSKSAVACVSHLSTSSEGNVPTEGKRLRSDESDEDTSDAGERLRKEGKHLTFGTGSVEDWNAATARTAERLTAARDAAEAASVFACHASRHMHLVIEALLMLADAHHASDWCAYAGLMTKGPVCMQ